MTSDQKQHNILGCRKKITVSLLPDPIYALVPANMSAQAHEKLLVSYLSFLVRALRTFSRYCALFWHQHALGKG